MAGKKIPVHRELRKHKTMYLMAVSYTHLFSHSQDYKFETAREIRILNCFSR